MRVLAPILCCTPNSGGIHDIARTLSACSRETRPEWRIGVEDGRLWRCLPRVLGNALGMHARNTTCQPVITSSTTTCPLRHVQNQHANRAFTRWWRSPNNKDDRCKRDARRTIGGAWAPSAVKRRSACATGEMQRPSPHKCNSHTCMRNAGTRGQTNRSHSSRRRRCAIVSMRTGGSELQGGNILAMRDRCFDGSPRQTASVGRALAENNALSRKS